MVRMFTCCAFAILFAAASLGETLLIPYAAFPDPQHARKVKEVVDHCTFHRRLDESCFRTTSTVLNYLLDRMSFTSVMMRHLGLEKYVIAPGEDGTMTYDDKAGMVGTFEPVYATDDKRILYGDGTFDIGILGEVRGQSVLVMDYSSEEPEVVCNRVTVFIRVRGILGPLCKLASPILNGMVGRKSAALLEASVKLSERLASDPESVYEEIRDCEDVTADDLKDFRRAFLITAE